MPVRVKLIYFLFYFLVATRKNSRSYDENFLVTMRLKKNITWHELAPAIFLKVQKNEK